MKHDNVVPEVSMAFFDHGQVAWAKGYGLADVAAKAPVTPATLFQAAAVSKSVTALTALRLVQQGKLGISAFSKVTRRSARAGQS